MTEAGGRLPICRSDGRKKAVRRSRDKEACRNKNVGFRRILMEIKRIDYDFSVCKVEDFSMVDPLQPFYFTGRTDEENSLVCITENVPKNVTERDDGWKAFRIQGVLDFSLIGILSEISSLMAQNDIGIFAISTYNTDYILVKRGNYEKALQVLLKAGYQIV